MIFLASFVLLYQPRGLYVINWLPSVIALWVALPFDKILQLFFLSMTSVAPDGLDFILFLVVDKVRWGPQIVFSMFACLYVGGQKRGVENRVYGPLGWEAQL